MAKRTLNEAVVHLCAQRASRLAASRPTDSGATLEQLINGFIVRATHGHADELTEVFGEIYPRSKALTECRLLLAHTVALWILGDKRPYTVEVEYGVPWVKVSPGRAGVSD